MQPESLPFHFASIASIIADVWVGLVAAGVYRVTKEKGWLFLSIGCALFLVGSAYSYLFGLAEFGLLEWPFNDGDTLRAYYMTSFISIASQMCFVMAVVLIAKQIYNESNSRTSRSS